ncbi:hypothetical protein ACFZAV_44260 [Streptomyces sp. NPDC008343]|uniref:hypothetical protein n=1 Tax=Streptomyces sp. NPDC008343 TaxID=3364828 RepID=UPI0036EE5DFE
MFRFPLREAQRLEYFRRINYRAVFGVQDVDRELAELAVGQLRADREAGHGHLLMARAESIPKAEELRVLYQE